MTWFKVDDNLAFHTKTIQAGNAAMGLWVRAGSWSAQQLTEGFIPWAVIDTLGTRKQAAALVTCGLWTAGDEGCQFWQWSEDGRQPTKESVLSERAAARERQRRARQKASASRRDEDVTDGVTPAAVTVPPSRPVPSRPTNETSRDQSSPTNGAEPVDNCGLDGLVQRSRLFNFDAPRVRQELTRLLGEFPDDDMVMHVASTILGRASTVPDDATAFLIGAFRRYPQEAEQLAYGGAA